MMAQLQQKKIIIIKKEKPGSCKNIKLKNRLINK